MCFVCKTFQIVFFSGFFFLLYFLKVSVALYIYDSILCHQIKFFSDFNSFCGVKYNTFTTSWCLDDIMATSYSKNSKLNLLEKFLRKMDDRNWFHWRKDLTVILEYVGMLGKLWLDSKMLIRMDFFFCWVLFIGSLGVKNWWVSPQRPGAFLYTKANSRWKIFTRRCYRVRIRTFQKLSYYIPLERKFCSEQLLQ